MASAGVGGALHLRAVPILQLNLVGLLTYPIQSTGMSCFLLSFRGCYTQYVQSPTGGVSDSESAWALLPESPPDGVEPWETIAIGQTSLSPRQALAYLWSHSILRAAREAGILESVEGFLRANGNARVADISAGFIPFGDIEDFSRSGQRQSIFQRMWKLGAPSSRQIWAFDGPDRWGFRTGRRRRISGRRPCGRTGSPH